MARVSVFPSENHSVRFGAVSPGLPDISRVTAHRGFGGHAPGVINSAILTGAGLKSASRRFWDTGMNPTERWRQLEVAISRERVRSDLLHLTRLGHRTSAE